LDLIASPGTESAELIGLRLRQSGLWLGPVLDTARHNQTLEAPVLDTARHAQALEAPVLDTARRAQALEAPVLDTARRAQTLEAPVLDTARRAQALEAPVLGTARHAQTLEAPGPSPRRYLTLKLDTALKLEAGAVPRGASKDAAGGLGGPKYGGFACLASHAWAVGNQLRAIRQAFVIAALLKRTLVLPRLTCHCDRDPSGTLTELIAKGCQLPTAEAERYLPFECPLEHLLNLEVWDDAAARDATYTLLPASTVLPAASTPLTPAALATALARAGPPASQPLGAVLGEEEPTAAAVGAVLGEEEPTAAAVGAVLGEEEPTAAAIVLELTWPTTGDAPLSAKARVSSELGGRSSELGGRSSELGLELERLLALGPAGA
jgi:hypothetical protein